MKNKEGGVMSIERELFEVRFTRPQYIYWDKEKGKYNTDCDNADIVCNAYNNMWSAWQAFRFTKT